jgi:hypothetical protein
MANVAGSDAPFREKFQTLRKDSRRFVSRKLNADAFVLRFPPDTKECFQRRLRVSLYSRCSEFAYGLRQIVL